MMEFVKEYPWLTSVVAIETLLIFAFCVIAIVGAVRVHNNPEPTEEE